ncbi:DinB superfamily protein [Brevibacterium sp. Mu109]|uniref:mycothiol transferase n=1 Tax=Brevibacterium sp. Mu109 TaxID=1255669 RepID=UPI000C3EC76F|nr:DinB family protein [Brevibacterium sp. Mu109]SMX89768.1 DinB superfamily protein [Brevibacterium sp. Mu109]
MDARELLTDLANRPLQELDHFWDSVTAEMLNSHPAGHPNSIAWLVWHTGREIDVQVAHASSREEIWAQGWSARFDLGVSDDDIGLGHTEDEARAIVIENKDLLRGYLSAVTDESLDYISTLSPDDLSAVIDESWDPPVTRGARLVSIYADALQHMGQAAYVTGTQQG